MTWIERLLLAALLCFYIAYLGPDALHRTPTSAEIRLDTGDLRYLRGDQVIDYLEMPEPYRSTLLSASEHSDVLRNEWHQCATFPLPGSNHSHVMCQDFYMDAAAWLKTDREIGLFVAEDVARYVETTDGAYSLPDSFSLLHWEQLKRDGVRGIRDDWKNDPEVTEYLRERGLVD